MSEFKETNTKNNNIITLDRFEALKDKINNQDLLIRAITTKEAELKTELRLLKQEKEDKSKEIKIVNVDGGPFGGGKISVEYKNLPDLEKEAIQTAREEVKEELKDLKEQKEEAEEELKKLSRSHKDKVEDLKYSYERQIKNIKRSKEEDIEAKQDRIYKLEDEIIKLKDNKSNEELEKKRKEEINNYKKVIAKLESRLNKYESLNWFERIIAKISNKKADEKAVEELHAAKEAVKGSSSNGRYYEGTYYYRPF